MGVWGTEVPQRGPGSEPLVGGSGGTAPRKLIVVIKYIWLPNHAQFCVFSSTALQLVGHVEQLWLTSNYDVIHEIGCTYRITTPPDEDRATALGNVHTKKCGEDWTCSSEDMIVDRQTHRQTDRQTDTLITILRSPIGGGQAE